VEESNRRSVKTFRIATEFGIYEKPEVGIHAAYDLCNDCYTVIIAMLRSVKKSIAPFSARTEKKNELLPQKKITTCGRNMADARSNQTGKVDCISLPKLRGNTH
jgi:hypothetical protein